MLLLIEKKCRGWIDILLFVFHIVNKKSLPFSVEEYAENMKKTDFFIELFLFFRVQWCIVKLENPNEREQIWRTCGDIGLRFTSKTV